MLIIKKPLNNNEECKRSKLTSFLKGKLEYNALIIYFHIKILWLWLLWVDAVVVIDFPLFFLLYFSNSLMSSCFYFLHISSRVLYFCRSWLVLFKIVYSFGFYYNFEAEGSKWARLRVVFLLSLVFSFFKVSFFFFVF